jgi:hypothetical protein
MIGGAVRMTKFTASKLSKILKEHKRWDCTVKKEGNRANLNGANLRKAELSDAYLRKADLNAANLSGAELIRANLSDAILSDANLSGANLSGANLSDAILSGANLDSAKLNNADLNGADLSFAALGEADLREANLQGVAGLGPEDISVVVTLHKAKLDPRLMEAVKNKYPHLLEDMNAKDSIENSQKADTGNISKNQPNNLESKVRGEDLGGVDTLNKSDNILHIWNTHHPAASNYAPTSNSMDCDYAKDGPKNCIFIETTEDGPVGKCIKAQRAKKLRFLPWTFTNVLIKIGCPSNRVFFVCDYLKKESIKI